MGRRCPRGLEPPPRSAPARSGFGSSIGYHPAAARPDHWAASARPRSPGFRSKGREPRRPVGVSSHCGATGHSTFPPTRETPARRRVQCHWGHPGHRCPRPGVGSPLGSQQLFWKWLKTPKSDPPPRLLSLLKTPAAPPLRKGSPYVCPTPSGRLGVLIHFHPPVTPCGILPHHLSPGSGQSPLRWESTHATAGAPTPEDAAPRAPPAPRAHLPPAVGATRKFLGL